MVVFHAKKESSVKANRLYLVLILLTALVVVASGCRSSQVEESVLKTVYVAPTTITCPGTEDQSCLLVAEDILTHWQARSKAIEGFAYQPGFLFTLAVRESGRSEPRDWTLEYITTQEPARIRAVTIGPERVACTEASVGQMCLVYREGPQENWQILAVEIGGFEPEPGFAHHLTILERTTSSPENTSSTWTVMQVVNREPMSMVDVQIVLPEETGPDSAPPTASAWQEVHIPSLGLRTALPQSWQPLGNDSANLRAWSDGTASFVNFSATPGNNEQAILAQLAGTGTPGSLSPEQLSTTSLGGRTWFIYSRNYGEISLSASVTLDNGMAYIVSLSAPMSEQSVLLPRILENFSLQQP